jgi:hypothetical protein
MPVFSTTGSRRIDLWLVDGSPEFGWLSMTYVGLVAELAPIHLKVGDCSFGQLHIEQRHGHWVNKLKTTVPELVWSKLQRPAQIYGVTPLGRFVFSFRFSPEAVMIIEWRVKESCYSVVTLYSHPQKIDGRHLGRYRPNVANDQNKKS